MKTSGHLGGCNTQRHWDGLVSSWGEARHAVLEQLGAPAAQLAPTPKLAVRVALQPQQAEHTTTRFIEGSTLLPCLVPEVWPAFAYCHLSGYRSGT